MEGKLQDEFLQSGYTDVIEFLKKKVTEQQEALDYVLTAKPEHYHNAKNMLNDFKLVIGLTLKGN